MLTGCVLSDCNLTAAPTSLTAGWLLNSLFPACVTTSWLARCSVYLCFSLSHLSFSTAPGILLFSQLVLHFQGICKILHLSFFSAFLYRFLFLLTHSGAFPDSTHGYAYGLAERMLFQSNLNFKFSLSCLSAIAPERRLILHQYYSPAYIALRVTSHCNCSKGQNTGR